jgi:hypothetical protein
LGSRLLGELTPRAYCRNSTSEAGGACLFLGVVGCARDAQSKERVLKDAKRNFMIAAWQNNV